MVHAIRKIERPNSRQNHFVAKEKKNKSEKKAKVSGPQITLPHLKHKPGIRIDRFGRPMSSQSETEFEKVMRDVKLNPVASSGNKFAANSESSKQQRLKKGKGIKFTLTLGLTLAAFTLTYMHPTYVPIFYVGTIVPLFLFRFLSYWAEARHHFCLEVCYFINYSVIVYIVFLPSNWGLFISAFNLSQSVGIGSTLLLNFKFVFSDIQTYINAYMHVMPAVTTFVIRYLINDGDDDADSPIDFTVKTVKLEDFVEYANYILLYPMAGYLAHMLCYNFWVWCVPHPRLRERRTYCNTFVKALSGGFGKRWVRVLSCWGKRWALWVYSLLQLVWASLMLVATSLLYIDFHANLIYLSVLCISIAANGGSFYSYKLKKLKEVEEKERLENQNEIDLRTFEERLYAEIDNATDDESDSDDERAAGGAFDRNAGSRKHQRFKATVIRSVTSFTHESNDYGREHRAKMANSSKKKGSLKNSKPNTVNPHSGGKKNKSARENASEEEVKFIAQQRRRDQKDSMRPNVF